MSWGDGVSLIDDTMVRTVPENATEKLSAVVK